MVFFVASQLGATGQLPYKSGAARAGTGMGSYMLIAFVLLIMVGAHHTAFAHASWQPSLPLAQNTGAFPLALAVIIVECVMTAGGRLRWEAQSLEASRS